jgi:hypothetical protein
LFSAQSLDLDQRRISDSVSLDHWRCCQGSAGAQLFEQTMVAMVRSAPARHRGQHALNMFARHPLERNGRAKPGHNDSKQK